jgi:hypothetical protein
MQHLMCGRKILAAHQNGHTTTVVEPRALLSGVVSRDNRKDSCRVQRTACEVSLHARWKNSDGNEIRHVASLTHIAGAKLPLFKRLLNQE